VHLNDSRDEFGSTRDRHANIGRGTIDPEELAAVCAAAGAPVVVETPAEGQAADISFLRERLGVESPAAMPTTDDATSGRDRLGS
jgi:deoxyribonuclease IV